MIRFPLKRCRVVIASIVAFSFVSGSMAGGFQLWEESAAGTGDYHAGGSAEADDASTEFYNPAGMIRLKRPQISTGVAYIPLRVKFNGDVNNAGIINSTNGYVSGNTDNFVPNFHFVYPASDNFAIGLGITAPFGLKTDYPDVFPSNEAATLTNLLTINVNPNIGFKVTKQLSLGVGVDYLYGKAQYNQSFFGQGPLDNTLTDWTAGWNAGALYQFNSRTRMGFSYRSEMVFNGTGVSTLTSGGTTITSNTLAAQMNLPASYILSVYSDLNKKWSILASAYYTVWDAFNRLQLHNTVIGNINDVFNYRNSWNLVLGFHYKINAQWMLKWGVAWDQTPTQDGYRDIRLPDANRYVAAIGVHWQATHRVGWDLGFVHFFTGSIDINNTKSADGTPLVLETGTAKNNTNVIGTQLTVDL